MGGRGRSRTQRRHFKENRENVWKRPKSDPSSENNNSNSSSSNNENSYWQPFATQNPAFDEYYKVLLLYRLDEYFSYTQTGSGCYLMYEFCSLFFGVFHGLFCPFDIILTQLSSEYYAILLMFFFAIFLMFFYFCGNTNLWFFTSFGDIRSKGLCPLRSGTPSCKFFENHCLLLLESIQGNVTIGAF